MSTIVCKPGCGACCIAPAISSPLPGMPHGKPAGVRCVNLDKENRCRLFGRPERPAVCLAFQADEEICSGTPSQSLDILSQLESETASTRANHFSQNSGAPG